MKRILSMFCMFCLAGIASGGLTISPGINWSFTAAANNLIAGQTPSAIVNTNANADGSPGAEVLTDQVVGAGSSNLSSIRIFLIRDCAFFFACIYH